jgi:hypothetical protein
VDAQRGSAHPKVPGVPWWGAVMIAVTATAIGFAFDASGGEELTRVFAVLYAIGCITAVVVVRHSGIFTAVVQPPMILFVSVPGAYFLIHGGQVNGIKDVVINCAYPLIERFPLMLFTSGIVLLIGLARWFVGGRSDQTQPTQTAAAAGSTGIAAKFAGIFSRSVDKDEEPAPKRRHAVNRSKSTSAAHPAKSARRGEPTRSRRSRTPLADDSPPKPRRRAGARQSDEPVDLPRRRSTAARSSRDPYERPESYERRAPHDRRSRYDSYDPFEAYAPPPRQRPGPGVANGAHHPISRVRYRGRPTDTETLQDRPARQRSRSNPDGREYDA